MSIKIPSKQAWSDKPKNDFPLLPHDEYELLIAQVEEKQQEKYQSHDMEDVVNITLEVKGLKGSIEEPKDVDGNTALGRKIWFTARPDSLGFMQDGTPSKTRCFLCYAFGKDINAEWDMSESWNDLVGLSIYAEISSKRNTKGREVNFISRIVMPPRSK